VADGQDDWPFDDPPNLASFTTANVIDRGDPILFVTHDKSDGAWQFLCGKTNSPEDARVVGLDCALKLDSSLAALADLPRGWQAWREDVRSPWKREPLPPESDE